MARPFVRSSTLPLLALALAAGGCASNEATPIDAGHDGGIDPAQAAICQGCTAAQICVQTMHSNGTDTCQSLSVACQPRDSHCTGSACSPDCQFWQCNGAVDAGVFSCTSPVGPCPNTIPGALQCWGP